MNITRQRRAYYLPLQPALDDTTVRWLDELLSTILLDLREAYPDPGQRPELQTLHAAVDTALALMQREYLAAPAGLVPLLQALRDILTDTRTAKQLRFPGIDPF